MPPLGTYALSVSCISHCCRSNQFGEKVLGDESERLPTKSR